MTKEQITYKHYSNNTELQTAYEWGYKDSAEPREKQIQIDAEHIIALQKQNGELTDKVKKLEAQIEIMKCCLNCDFIFWDGNCYYGKECKNKDHWKLKEIKEK